MTNKDFKNCILLNKDDIPNRKALIQAALRLQKDASIYSKNRSTYNHREGFDSDILMMVSEFLSFLSNKNVLEDNNTLTKDVPAYEETKNKRLCQVCNEGYISQEEEIKQIKQIYKSENLKKR